jgi:hypothetical protein
MAGIIGAVVVLVGGCVAVLGSGSNEGAIEVVDPPNTTEQTDSSQVGSDDDPGTDLENEPEVGAPGSRDNPLALGQLHSRNVGFTGTGWDISIDKIERIGLGPLSSSEDTGECLVISGTAVAREVDTEDGLSNIFSFPEVVVVVDGVQVSGLDSPFACDAKPAGYESHLQGVDMSLAEGGSANWVTVFNLREVGGQIDWIAIEEVVYQHE